MKGLYEKYKTHIYFGVLAIAIVFAFFFFFGDDDEAALVSQSPASSSASGEVGRELLSQLLSLRSITLNEQIFSEPGFRLLRDFSQEIPPQPVGRRNPFAPLEGGVAESE